MPIKIGIITDPVENIDIDKDTTYGLALEAQARGFELWTIGIRDLVMNNETPACKAAKIRFNGDYPCHTYLSDPEERNLDDFDAVLMRKDPPFDTEFFFATHFLSLCKKAKVLNNPESLRNAPEKIYALNFPGVFPETVVSCQSEVLRAFLAEQGEIIIKPLDGCGGQGVVYLQKGDKNFNSIVELSTKEGTEYIMAQRYLPEVRQGDKRVICVNGKAVGAVLRVPQEDEHRSNIHAGGQTRFAELTKQDQWLVDQVSERLAGDGLYFVGLDVIGDYITEINVTSPTGIREIMALGGIDIAKMFWDGLNLN